MARTGGALSPGALTGKTISHYAVQDRLGSGGMAVVYRAQDLRLGRPVALKVLPPGLVADPDRKRRLIREACAASALNHPNIVTIYDIGQSDGVDFIAMELVSGRTLEAVVQEGNLRLDEALRLAAALADALAAAHAAGLVHRDLKPSNVMVTTGGRPKILDFGLAKPAAEPLGPGGAEAATVEAMTGTGVIVGTLPYMSPEQATGRPVDGRSDIFSFGALLYEMLSGRRAFSADNPALVLAAILGSPPAPLPQIPRDVWTVVDRCLCKRPEERYQSAGDLKNALEACLAPGRQTADASIAVLPFANMNRSQEGEHLCEGLAEEIINALTLIPELRVMARTSSFLVGGMNLDVCEMCTRLGVSTLLEGSVRLAGTRVRVTAQLVRGCDGSHLWSERYDRELADVFALEDEIAGKIAARLQGDLAKSPALRTRRPADPSAYQAYLEGRYHFARGTGEALTRARACYERAIALDPEFALAYDGIAEVFWYLGFYGAMPPREAFSISTWNALQALERDESSAEAHALLGMLRKELDYNWPEVEREFALARKLNPGSAIVRLRYAVCGLMPHGRTEEAVEMLRGVVADDPLSLFAHWWLAAILGLDRQPEAMHEEADRMLELDSNYFFGHWARGTAFDGAGRPEEAVPAFERAFELSGHSAFTMGYLGRALGCAGRTDEARELLARAATLSRDAYWPPMVFAFIHTGLGEWDSAFEWMDKAIETRDPFIMPIKSYHFLDPVRSDPRFAVLLQKMNLG